MVHGNEKIKILVIDDDEDDFFIIAGYINDLNSNGFEIDWCNDYVAALNKLKGNTYQIYLVDYRLGSRTGLDLLREAIQQGCEEPVVLLTGKGNRAIDIEAMKSGATDYLIKSELNTDKLERCIRYSLDRAAGLKAIKESESKYRNLFSGSKDALFIADRDLQFREVNQSASALIGLGNLELQARHLYEFISDQNQKERQNF